MKLLVIDIQGTGLDIVLRAQKAGHTVKWFIRQTPKTTHIGKGFADIIKDFKPHLRWADLILHTDNTFYVRELDGFRKEKSSAGIVGATADLAEWELDREAGMEAFKDCGIDVPSYEIFSNYDKAISYVKKEMKRFVSKPSGDADKALSYTSKSPADMVYMLDRWKKLGKLKSPFILQEFVEGTEMAVGGWFGPGGFNAGWCENWEFKKLCNDDLGVATGEQGTVLRYVRTSKLANQVLLPFEETLEKLGYCGYIDVNCIIDAQGKPWPLEFTMRFGWPTFNIQQALHIGDPIEWLSELTMGRDAKVFQYDTIAIGVVLSVPDYPYSHATRKEIVGAPIWGIKPSTWNWLHPGEMMMGTGPIAIGGNIETIPLPVTAGDYVMVVSATGETVKQVKGIAYRRLKKLTLPSSPMYRTDIGDRLKKQLPLLQAHGYATEMVY